MEHKMSLESKVRGFWTGRDKNSAYGLKLLDQCITRFAEHGDWDHLSRFYVGALKVGQGPAVKRIIRAAFGQSVKFSLDSKHPTGGKFAKINWPGVSFPLHESNTYSVVKKSVEQGLGWDSKVFQKALADVLPDLPKKTKTVDAATQTKEAKALATKLKTLRDAGFDLAALVREAQALLSANPQANADKTVEKKVVNGTTVYEPAF